MKIIHKGTIDYSDLGNVILYTGPLGNGKTLAAVRQLAEEKDTRRIVTNLISLSLPHETLDINRLPEYRNSRLFIDNSQSLMDRRRRGISVNMWSGFLRSIRHFNTKLIMTSQRYEYLPRSIRELVDTVLVPIYHHERENSDLDKVGLTLYSVLNPDTVVTYTSFEAKPYWSLYNTMEMVQAQRISRTRTQIQLVGPKANQPNTELDHLYYVVQAIKLDRQLRGKSRNG